MSKSIYEWAVEFCGDPASHVTRGAELLSVLIENGLKPEHRVLDLGCGALSQGVPLINYLNEGNYVGLDPNGWLIEAALQEHRGLANKRPRFSYTSDFTTPYGPFDFVVSHSVLSHAAHWQMEQALANIRQVVNEGAVWFASLRLDQFDLYARTWVYPGVSYFRIETVKVLGWHAGWHVEHLPALKERLTAVAPNDFHDWIKLTAIPTQAEMNAMRIDDEQRRKDDERILQMAKDLYEQDAAIKISSQITSKMSAS